MDVAGDWYEYIMVYFLIIICRGFAKCATIILQLFDKFR